MKEWYENSWNNVVKRLNTDIYKGLSENLAQERLKAYGENRIIYASSRKYFNLVLEVSRQFWFIYMIINSILFLYLRSYIYSAALLAIAVITLIFHVISIKNGEKRLELLKDLDSMSIKVIREGKTCLLPIEKVVLGDIVIIDKGMAIPADLRLIEVENLKVKESAVTGEDLIVEKFETKIDYYVNSLAEIRNMVFRGSRVIDGSGIGVVVATGMNTAIGNIIRFVSNEGDNKDSLIRKVTGVISGLGMIFFSIVLLAMGYVFIKDHNLQLTLSFGAEMLFVSFPYGMVIIYLMAFIFLTKKININGLKVRSLDSISRIASISNIVFDKLGSLSKVEMEVKEVYTNNTIYSFSQPGLLKEYNIERIIHTMVLCNDSKYDVEKDITIGDYVEGAFLKFGAENEIYRGILEREQPRIFQIPYDPQKKISTTVNKVEDKYRAYVKGAVDSILGLCTHIMKDGIEKEIEDSDIQNIRDSDMNMSGKGLNVIAIAYRNFSYEPSASENIESHLVFVGLVAVENPLLEEADLLLRKCRQLHIRPIIMSEDNKLTAYTIGKKLGIATYIERVLSDIEISNMDFEELKRTIKKVSVLTKLSYDNKTRVSRALKENDSRLMLTGSSFTELPALNNASISVSIGDNCSSMLKKICDIHIGKDYLYNMLNAISKSRLFMNNIKYAIGYICFSIFSQITIYVLNLILSNSGDIDIIYFALINMVLVPILVLLILAYNNGGEKIYSNTILDFRTILQDKGANSILLGLLTGLLAFTVKTLVPPSNIYIKFPFDIFTIVVGQLIYVYSLLRRS